LKHYIEYLKYVLRHKYYVFIETYKHGIIWRGIVHDLSKFRFDEFKTYSEYLYNPDTIVTHQEFQKIVFLHKRRNKHHWEYWVLKDHAKFEETVFPMDSVYVLEMICDWIGTGKAVGNHSPKNDQYLEVRKWYSENKDKLILHPYTRNFIEDIIRYKK